MSLRTRSWCELLLLSCPLLCPSGRWYIREGWLKTVPPKGKETKPKMFFLFSDILVQAKRCSPMHPTNGDKLACQRVYPLKECTVDKVFGHTKSQGGLISVSVTPRTLLLHTLQYEGWVMLYLEWGIKTKYNIIMIQRRHYSDLGLKTGFRFCLTTKQIRYTEQSWMSASNHLSRLISGISIWRCYHHLVMLIAYSDLWKEGMLCSWTFRDFSWIPLLKILIMYVVEILEVLHN